MKICDQDIKTRGRLIRIARLDSDRYSALLDPKPVIEGIKQCGSRIDLFTFMQILPEAQPRFPYLMEWDNLAALPVSTFDHWWTRQIDGKTRNMVRRAEKKGIAIREVPFNDEFVKGICQIYNESPVRQGRPFPHYGKDLETICRMKATFLPTSVFIGAYFEERLIGFVKLTCDEAGGQASIMHIVSMMLHRDKAPTNALVAHAVRACADRRIPYLVYSNFAYGKKQRDSLSDFKENNGFQRVDLPRYYVPLTLLGRVAFQLGMHHRMVDRVPESVLAKLREYRTSWYGSKHQTSHA